MIRGGGLLKQIVVAIVVCGFLVAQTKRPERQVEGNTITSERDPKVRIQLPKSGAVRRRRPMGALRHCGLRTARVRRRRSGQKCSAALLGAVRRLPSDEARVKTQI